MARYTMMAIVVYDKHGTAGKEFDAVNANDFDVKKMDIIVDAGNGNSR